MDGNDALSGNSGSNTLIDGIGNDTIRGGSGNVQLIPNDGHCELSGETGSGNVTGHIDDRSDTDTVFLADDDPDQIRGSYKGEGICADGGGDSLEGGFGAYEPVGEEAGNDDLVHGGLIVCSLIGESRDDQLRGRAGEIP